MCVLIFCTNFVRDVFHSKTNWARYDQKCVLVFMWSTGWYCPVLMKLQFSPNIFEKKFSPNIFEKKCLYIKKISWKICTVGAEFLHADRRRAWHDDANSRFTKFCERGLTTKNVKITEKTLGIGRTGGSRYEVLPHLLVFTRPNYRWNTSRRGGGCERGGDSMSRSESEQNN